MCLNLPWHQYFLKSNIYKEKLVGLWFLKKSPNCLPTACWGFSCWFASASACPVCLLWENACEVHLHVLKLNHCKVCTCQNPCNKNQSQFFQTVQLWHCVFNTQLWILFSQMLFGNVDFPFPLSLHAFISVFMVFWEQLWCQSMFQWRNFFRFCLHHAWFSQEDSWDYCERKMRDLVQQS